MVRFRFIPMPALHHVTIALLSFFCLGAVGGCGATSVTASSPGASSNTPTSTTPATAVLGDVGTLGGTLRGFTQTLNAPFSQQNTFSVTLENTPVDISVTLTSGVDEHEHASEIIISPHDMTSAIPIDTATAIVNHFLPTDAQHVHDVPSAVFTDHIFTSAALAATFHADAFMDVHKQIVAPGTFAWYCSLRLEDNKANTCVLSLGQH